MVSRYISKISWPIRKFGGLGPKPRRSAMSARLWVCHCCARAKQSGPLGLRARPCDRSPRNKFYSRDVSLEGEPERDVIVFLVKKDQELVAIASLQRSEDTLTLYGRLGVIAPRYRGEKLAYMGPALLEAVGRAMGMEVIYLLAEFTIPNMQRVMERAGFQIVGIVPASDRLMVAPGVIKRVHEAYYVKVLAADAEILRPQVESMTPRTKALYDFLFAA